MVSQSSSQAVAQPVVRYELFLSVPERQYDHGATGELSFLDRRAVAARLQLCTDVERHDQERRVSGFRQLHPDIPTRWGSVRASRVNNGIRSGQELRDRRTAEAPTALRRVQRLQSPAAGRAGYEPRRFDVRTRDAVAAESGAERGTRRAAIVLKERSESRGSQQTLRASSLPAVKRASGLVDRPKRRHDETSGGAVSVKTKHASEERRHERSGDTEQDRNDQTAWIIPPC